MTANVAAVNIVETEPNIRAAIERSRCAREALKRRRRRAAIVASLSIAAAVPLGLATLGVTGGHLVYAATSGAKSLADLLDQRSPGERTGAQLTKSKKMRALAKLQPAPPSSPVPPRPDALELAKLLMPTEPVSTAIEMPAAVVAFGPTPTLGTIIGPNPGGSGPPGGTLVTPPGGGGTPPGGGGSPPTTPTQPPLVPTSPVPEPGTWATMLLGFGLIGWRIRRGTKVWARPLPA